ncbi:MULTISPECIES: hypothetical protein [Streptomyces]|uniref:Uncharacterized protein n=1 Tax=Streptomyces evansiae TaxID=3075535 RepID=A0ABU2R3M8_9ACTN|nr:MULTISPECIES: hypothetical protein [unclassified Streptomyces]MDT0411311.1 hypothetical protein [Streptomyces sp. DSM 41979]MYQ56806.1 hypothetical protein [Streptomyces sp. SID4926]SCD46053.1 hypothetical protein GA0115252_106911 [Streptomyces sp. DfronAA-171]
MRKPGFTIALRAHRSRGRNRSCRRRLGPRGTRWCACGCAWATDRRPGSNTPPPSCAPGSRGTTELTELATVEEVRLPRTAEETTPSLGFGDFWYDVLVNITPDLITAATVVLYRLLRSRQPRSEQEETVTIHFEDGSRHTPTWACSSTART